MICITNFLGDLGGAISQMKRIRAEYDSRTCRFSSYIIMFHILVLAIISSYTAGSVTSVASVLIVQKIQNEGFLYEKH